MDHVAHENPDEVDLLTENDNKSKSRDSSKISETKHQSCEGKLKCTGYGLKKPKKQEKKLKCPDTNCDKIFHYVKSLNHHMKEVHPDMNLNVNIVLVCMKPIMLDTSMSIHTFNCLTVVIIVSNISCSLVSEIVMKVSILVQIYCNALGLDASNN